MLASLRLAWRYTVASRASYISRYRSIYLTPETLPCLLIYLPQLPTELHCYASSVGLGAILLQKQSNGTLRPVSYFSHRITSAESKYHSFELECLVAIYAIKRFHIYLFGRPFKLVTDCDSFRLTLNKQVVNPRIARWAIFLQSYDFQIEHRSNKRMSHVDASAVATVYIS